MSANQYQTTVGNDVVTRDGATVGRVAAVVDQPGQKPFLQVKDNGLFGIGAQHFLVPVDAIISIENGQVQVNRTSQDLVGIPAHDDHDAHQPDYFESLYAWWGRANEN